MNLNSGLIADRKLWLGSGYAAIEARATLYQCGDPDTFELYLSHSGQVPVRYVGSLGLMMNKGQHFVDSKKAEGYVEDMPANYPAIPGDTLSIG